jgi:hypothetical protein
MAASLHAGPGAAVSHRAAAALWRLEGIGTGTVEITTSRLIRAAAIVSHGSPLSRRHVAWIGPIPVTDPARTLLDLGAVVPPGIVERALDDALRRDLTTLDRLWRRLRAEAERGRSGVGVLRQVLEARDPSSVPPESELEARLGRLIIASGLPAPVAQHEIRVGTRLLGRVDFAWPDAMVAVEADGYRFHGGRPAWQRDLARRNRITVRGWRMIHVTWDDVTRRPETVTAALRAALRPTAFS